MTPTRTLIIGGGVAGLAAALRLGRAGGFAPLVIEADDRPGGMARSLNFKGVSTDLGPHRIHTQLPEVAALIDEICAPSLYKVRRKSRIYLQGRFIEYPPSPIEMTMHLGPIRMTHFGLSMMRQYLRPADAHETYESLMRRAFGDALYEFLLRPYSEKVWKTDPAEIHADTARVRVSAGSLAKLVRGLFAREKPGGETALREFKYVKGGIETMVRHLVEHAEAAGAEIRCSTPAAALELGASKTPGRRRVVAARCGDGGAERIDADAVVSTAPLPILLGEMLPPMPELQAAREAAASLTYLEIILVIVLVKRKIISGDNWLYFPEPRWMFNRAYESKSFDPELGPEDRSVLCVELTCRRGDDLSQSSDEEIEGRVIAQLEETDLFRADEVDETRVVRLRYGYPLYSLDYYEKLETIFDGLRSIENLLTSGRQGLFNHNNTDHSIHMGLRAADILIERGAENPAAAWYDVVDEFKHFRIVD